MLFKLTTLTLPIVAVKREKPYGEGKGVTTLSSAVYRHYRDHKSLESGQGGNLLASRVVEKLGEEGVVLLSVPSD